MTNQHVLRFQIAMADSLVMKVKHSSEHLIGIALEFKGSGSWPISQQFKEIALESFHNDIEILKPTFFGDKSPKDLDNIRTIQELNYFQLSSFVFFILLYFFQGYFVTCIFESSTINFSESSTANLMFNKDILGFDLSLRYIYFFNLCPIKSFSKFQLFKF